VTRLLCCLIVEVVPGQVCPGSALLPAPLAVLPQLLLLSFVEFLLPWIRPCCCCCWCFCRCWFRDVRSALLSARAALFAGAYSQLADWQAELVAAGLRHNAVSLYQLLAALERLGAAADCMQLAKLHDQFKEDDLTPHSFALQVSEHVMSHP